MFQNSFRILKYSLLFLCLWEFRNNEAQATKVNIITKSEWKGVDQVGRLTEQKWPIKRVIVAHTAGSSCKTLERCSELVRNIQEYHISQKYDDITYNFLVGNDGNVYEGRGWNFVGDAAKNYNKSSLNIAFIGTYITIAPSDKALNAAQSLLDRGVKTGKLIKNYKLYGHSQVKATLSPGETLYKIIQKWPHWSRNVE